MNCKVFLIGLHPGQNADPCEVTKNIETNLPGFDYLFKLNSVGQFDCAWSVFIRKQNGETD